MAMTSGGLPDCDAASAKHPGTCHGVCSTLLKDGGSEATGTPRVCINQ